MRPMIGFRVTDKFREFLQKMAEEENRSLSNFIINAILTYIKEHKKIDYKENPPKPLK